MSHLLLTNDYPPKIGGIQTYLWELWRRLPGESFDVFTSPHPESAPFDAAQHHRIHRHDRFWLPPTPRVLRRTKAIADSIQAKAVVIDPAFPLGAIGPRLDLPYAVVLHGAEVTVPARIPGSAQLLRRTVRNASLVISASRFAEAAALELAQELPPHCVRAARSQHIAVCAPGSSRARRGSASPRVRCRRAPCRRREPTCSPQGF